MLSPNWITDHTLDREYKRYILLAYAQEVDRAFNSRSLQPYLNDVSMHVDRIQQLKRQYEKLKKDLGGELLGINWKSTQLEYELAECEGWEPIQDISTFALEQLNPLKSSGEELLEDLEKQLMIYPLGIVPLYKREGYLLLTTGEQTYTTAYYYRLPFTQPVESFQQLTTEKIDEFPLTLSTTYVQVKRALTQRYELPNPAVFVVTSGLDLPLESTVIPMAQQKVIDAIC